MRLAVGSVWTSLTGLGVLLVASGCQLPVTEEGPDVDPSGDPNQHLPGTTPSTNPDRPPGTYEPPPVGGLPGAPRKLALDLSGVAGFAILDDESQSSAPLGALGGSNLDGGGSAMLRLESNLSGQLLTRSLDGVSRHQLLRSGLGVPGLAQEDPNAGAPPPPTGDSTAPLPGPAPVPETEASAGEQAGLLKIMDDGRIAPALIEVESPPEPATTAEPPPADGSAPTGDAPTPPPAGTSGGGSGANGEGSAGAPTAGPIGAPREPLPRVTALGLSPDGSVYVLFERGFYYRQPTAEEMAAAGSELYGPLSPLRCQLFRADGSWRDGAPDGEALAQLECVTNEHEVPTWDTRRVMQFDASGKLYFRAVSPAKPMGVFLQYNPETKALSEKVNANICWRDVQVTPRGSLFYTGSSGGSEGDCSGTSFFRYVSVDNRLTEIARDWWNFKYLAEQDPGAPDNERIIFYGPDPNSTGTYSWDSACLYRYNPAIATPAERTEKLVECYRDGWSYVNQVQGPAMPLPPTPEELPGFQERCESEGQLFIGGDGVSALSQLADGTLFVVGRFQRKVAGQLGCSLQVQGDHCAVLGTGMQGDALDAANDSEAACESAGHSWVFTGMGCSNGVDQSPEECEANEATWNHSPLIRYYDMTGPSCTASGEGITRNFVDCRAIGQEGSFTEEVNGLAYLVPATESEPSRLVLLSDPAERVERYWPLPSSTGAELFYATYSGGQYNLRMATQVAGEGGAVTIERRSLLDDYEVYNLQRDPANPSRVLFDALQFSTNSYLFGSIDPTLPTAEDVQASLQLVEGVSGRVETLIVLPNF